MANSRFELNSPILAIGIFIENKEGIRFVPSLDVYCLAKQMDQLFDKTKTWGLDDFHFKIIQVIPEFEYEVDIEYSENKGLGYVGVSPDLNMLFTLKPVLHNQYPRACYSQTSTESDWYWNLHFKEEPEGIIELLKENRVPYHYQGIEQFLDGIQYSIKNNNGDQVLNENLKKIYQDVIDELSKNFDIWDINYSTSEFFKYQKVTVTLKEGLVNGDGCSLGPVSSLPGERSTIISKTICDEHPNRLSVKRVQGETDSFGCEYLHMCQECYDKYLEFSRTPIIDTCDWCKSIDVEVFPRRDIEEGTHGPVYNICGKCIRKQNKTSQDELDGLC